MRLPESENASHIRPQGLSAFVRCKNEEEYIVASLLSAYRVFDEILVILNNSTDRTRDLVMDLTDDHPKIRLLEYPNECSAIGPGYIERIRKDPTSSLADYYNWCMRETRFSHVCKWDGDMIAIPIFEQIYGLIETHDVVMFDGLDVLGRHTTDLEARIFRFDLSRARYIDWDLYEVLEHDYHTIAHFDPKCYLHVKLVKRDWIHTAWSNPNLLAERSVPETGAKAKHKKSSVKTLLKKLARSVNSTVKN